MFITMTLPGLWMLLQHVIHSDVQLITRRPVLKFHWHWQPSVGLGAFVSSRRFHSISFHSMHLHVSGRVLFFQGYGVGFPHPEWLESLSRDLLSCGMTNRTHVSAVAAWNFIQSSIPLHCRSSTTSRPRSQGVSAQTHARVTGREHSDGPAVCGVLSEAQNMLCLCFFLRRHLFSSLVRPTLFYCLSMANCGNMKRRAFTLYHQSQ